MTFEIHVYICYRCLSYAYNYNYINAWNNILQPVLGGVVDILIKMNSVLLEHREEMFI